MTTDDSTRAKLLDEAITSMESAAANTAKLGADSDLFKLSQALLSADFSADSQLRNSLRDQLLSATGVQIASQPTSKPLQQASGTPQRNRYAGRLMTAATIAALIVLAFLAVPQLRSWAQDVIDGLFNRLATDTALLEYSITPETSEESQLQIFDTIGAAENAIGLDIASPTSYLDAYTQEAITYSSSTGQVYIDFAAPPQRQLVIILSPLDFDDPNYSQVGASANILPVEIQSEQGTLNGEYLAGAWFVPEEEIEETPNATGDVSMAVEWWPDAPTRRLRWQQGDWIYEIVAFGGNGDNPVDLMMEDLIALAESMR